MKQLSIIILLLLISCNTETNTRNGIDTSVYELWNDYTASNPQFKNEQMPESWFFHNNKEDADRLAVLTATGKKRAASGLYAWYEEAEADLPAVGTKHIITNFEGIAQAIIEIKKVDTIPFDKITPAYAAMDMGTDTAPLEKWKKAHWDFFVSTMEESEVAPTEEMLVVCEWFEVVWQKKQSQGY